MKASHTFELDSKYTEFTRLNTKIIVNYDLDPEFDREDGLTFRTHIESVCVEIGRDVIIEDMPFRELTLDLKDFIIEQTLKLDLSDYGVDESDLIEELSYAATDAHHRRVLR
jgi:hypothetical protein